MKIKIFGFEIEISVRRIVDGTDYFLGDTYQSESVHRSSDEEVNETPDQDGCWFV